MKIKSTFKLYRNGKFVKEVKYAYEPALFSAEDMQMHKAHKNQQHHAAKMVGADSRADRKPVKTPKKKLYTWWERQRTVLRNGSGNRLIKEEWVKRSALIEPRFIAMFHKPWLALDAQIKAEAARGYHAQLNANMSGEYV